MSFPIEGNSGVRKAVLNCIETSRIPHAIIIDGDVGTGKHTLALYIAKAVVCGGENKPCNECKGCHLVNIGSHPDVLSVCAQEGKKNISVAQIRELRADAYVKPHMADGKVYIISGADSMNEQAQNAFLKILEEPPAGVVFILLVESKAVLLDTIISRCVSFSLCAPDFEDSVKYIKAQTDIDDAVIKNALEQTSGNIGKALNILSGAGGCVLSNDANEFISFMLEGNCYGMLKVTSGYEKNRVLAEEFFKQIKLLVSEKVRENSGKVYKLKDLIEFYDKLCEYEKSLKTNINLSLLFSAIVCEAERIYS